MKGSTGWFAGIIVIALLSISIAAMFSTITISTIQKWAVVRIAFFSAHWMAGDGIVNTGLELPVIPTYQLVGVLYNHNTDEMVWSEIQTADMATCLVGYSTPDGWKDGSKEFSAEINSQVDLLAPLIDSCILGEMTSLIHSYVDDLDGGFPFRSGGETMMDATGICEGYRDLQAGYCDFISDITKQAENDRGIGAISTCQPTTMAYYILPVTIESSGSNHLGYLGIAVKPGCDPENKWLQTAGWMRELVGQADWYGGEV
ncbi:MAG: hypothetical protein GOU99_00820 [Candidatus Altiarchaeota archaeon]|nr:hypothetical protein [Candidatus Altiarchaeota archaeon]